MDENQPAKPGRSGPSRNEVTAAIVTSRYAVGGVAIGMVLLLAFLLDKPRVHTPPSTNASANSQRWDNAAFDFADAIPVAGQLAELPAQAAHLVDETKARVLIVRGVLTVFSLGMDDLAKKLRAEGYEVQVTTAANSNNVARRIRDQIAQSNSLGQRAGNRSLVIIGHSLGGDLAPKLAATFGERKIPVDVLIMLDSTMPSAPPGNVKRCVNLYQSNVTPEWARIFRGTDVQAKSPQTEMINIDIRKLAGKEQTAGINHFNIDANPWIHNLIVDAVQRVDAAAVESALPRAAPIATVDQRSTPSANNHPDVSQANSRRRGKSTWRPARGRSPDEIIQPENHRR